MFFSTSFRSIHRSTSIGRPSADSRPSVGQHSADGRWSPDCRQKYCQPTVDRQSTDASTDSYRQSVNCRPTGQLTVGRRSADASVDRRPTVEELRAKVHLVQTKCTLALSPESLGTLHSRASVSLTVFSIDTRFASYC